MSAPSPAPASPKPQRLTQSIGYIGAGTVEYLFNANTKEYYFLELNPRLQVRCCCSSPTLP